MPSVARQRFGSLKCGGLARRTPDIGSIECAARSGGRGRARKSARMKSRWNRSKYLGPGPFFQGVVIVVEQGLFLPGGQIEVESVRQANYVISIHPHGMTRVPSEQRNVLRIVAGVSRVDANMDHLGTTCFGNTATHQRGDDGPVSDYVLFFFYFKVCYVCLCV